MTFPGTNYIKSWYKIIPGFQFVLILFFQILYSLLTGSVFLLPRVSNLTIKLIFMNLYNKLIAFDFSIEKFCIKTP